MSKSSIIALLVLFSFLAIATAMHAYWWSPSLFHSQIDHYGMREDQTVNRKFNVDIDGKIQAPELEGGVGWLNVDRPLTLAELKGKVVLLDFWTFCCINCMHIIPDLKKLEAKYPQELVVIGVHSAKFDNEKLTENIRNAVLRYEIEHPIVNDADFSIWRSYGIRAWPTMAVIDPDGQLVGVLSGEGNYDLLDEVIARLIEKFEGKLNRTPLVLSLEKDKQPPAQLSFPGKVSTDASSRRLFVADSNHNRIIVSDLEGRVQAVIGDGEIGLRDGGYQEARFFRPQGMALHGDWLYVADTENHAIRRIDLNERKVQTIAGTGKQSHSRTGGPAAQTELNSPWDLTRIGNGEEVYIAMAGPHQIWIYRPDSETIEPFAGSGQENIIDGPLSQGALAQPSGIESDGVNLYFADSEVSALRMIGFTGSEPQLRTLIGTGLFDFGDRDGAFNQALLQHCLGVAYADGKVYVADAYNHKIKVADLQAQIIETFAGTGSPGIGTADVPQFNEPGGLAVAGDRLFVADTNNSVIRVVDRNTRKVSTLVFDFSQVESEKPVEFAYFGDPEAIELNSRLLALGGSVQVQFHFPEGFHFNPQVQPDIQLRITGEEGLSWVGAPQAVQLEGDVLTFDVAGEIEKAAKIEVALTYYYCRNDNQGQCFIGSAKIESPAGTEIDPLILSHTVRMAD